jgi:hypothetical protein
MAANQPGMYAPTGRCLTCDSRYCGPTCNAQEGHIMVPGKGWVAPRAAKALEAAGATIRWDDVWHD